MMSSFFARRRCVCVVSPLFTLAWLLIPVANLPAQLILSGGGLALVQEGPVADLAGDPVPDNLATGAIPFASSDLGPEIGVPFHATVNLNDGLYGNGFSWIGGDDQSVRHSLRRHRPGRGAVG